MTHFENGLYIPENYHHPLNIRETEIAIKKIKDFFEHALADQLLLTRVSAPLFVRKNTGLNDDLNGIERPVGFDMKGSPEDWIEIVHSLAKWKRNALKRYGFNTGEGLYTDMNAIRRDEDLDNLHSIYVDQWDWEKSIEVKDRTKDYLKTTVEIIFQVMKDTEAYVHSLYPMIEPILPQNIQFVSTQELEDQYPDLTPKEREDAISKLWGAVFISQIGHTLNSGIRHDGRAPDYDDWNLNGDILVYHPVLERAFELSSMGIRVDENSLAEQCSLANCVSRLDYPFHQAILRKHLPYSIGGGIGQSRLCMYFLRKAHIGEVQASIWPSEMEERCLSYNIRLL